MLTDRSQNRILVVDDEIGIRHILQRMLGGSGYVVACGESAVQGLELFHRSGADLVIVDRGMPEMSGEEMAERIKSTHPSVPLILITGLPHLITRPELFAAILSKPFGPAELMARVSQAMAAGAPRGDLGRC